MSERAPNPGPDDGDGAPPGGESPPGMPGWVKLAIVVAGVLLVLLVVTQLVGGVDHGPGLHAPPVDH